MQFRLRGATPFGFGAKSAIQFWSCASSYTKARNFVSYTKARNYMIKFWLQGAIQFWSCASIYTKARNYVIKFWLDIELHQG